MCCMGRTLYYAGGAATRQRYILIIELMFPAFGQKGTFMAQWAVAMAMAAAMAMAMAMAAARRLHWNRTWTYPGNAA